MVRIADFVVFAPAILEEYHLDNDDAVHSCTRQRAQGHQLDVLVVSPVLLAGEL